MSNEEIRRWVSEKQVLVTETSAYDGSGVFEAFEKLIKITTVYQEAKLDQRLNRERERIYLKANTILLHRDDSVIETPKKEKCC